MVKSIMHFDNFAKPGLACFATRPSLYSQKIQNRLPLHNFGCQQKDFFYLIFYFPYYRSCLRIMYVICIHDPSSYELEQLMSNDDKEFIPRMYCVLCGAQAYLL